jgi:hypothetical protein
MLQTLMEENEEEAPKDDDKEDNAKKEDKAVDKVGFGTKVKATIDRFLNWIKKIITNLKGQLMKVGQRINAAYTSMILKKAIKKVEKDKDDATYNVSANVLVDIAKVTQKDELEEAWKEIIKGLDEMIGEFSGKDLNNVSLDELKKGLDEADGTMKGLDDILNIAKDEGDKAKASVNKKELLDALKKMNGNSMFKGISMTQKALDIYNKAYNAIAKTRKDVNDPRKVNVLLSALTKSINGSLKLTNKAFSSSMKAIRACKLVAEKGDSTEA